MKKSALFSLVLSFLAYPAFAEIKVTTTAQGGFAIESCDNYKEKSLVGFQVGDNGLEQLETAKNGCATKTYSAGVINRDSKIVVKQKGKADKSIIIRDGLSRNERSGHGNSNRGGYDSSNQEIGIIGLKAQLIDDNTVEITGCNPKIKPPVSIGNRSRGNGTISKMADVKRRDGTSCFIVQFKKGEIYNDDEIGVGIYGVEKPIAVKVGNLPWRTQGSVGNNNGSNSGSGNNNSGSNNEQREEEIRKIRNNGKSAANRFSNLVVKGLGRIENVRYNLFLGFRQGESVYRFSERGYTMLPEYSSGMQAGRMEARNSQAGITAGRNKAQADAGDLAKQDVVAQFENAMSTGQRPSMSPRTHIQNEFAGLAANLDQPKTVIERFKDQDKRRQERIRAVTVIDEVVMADSIYATYYSVHEIFSLSEYKFELLLSNYRGEKAFESWRENIFNDNSGTHAYYNSLSASDRRIFINEFVEQYDDVINKKWNAVVTQANPQAMSLGLELYRETSQNYAYDLGKTSGYTQQYKNDSIAAYGQNLYPTYVEAYRKLFNSYMTSAIITEVSVDAVPATADASLTLGDAISIVLRGASNKGMADGEVTLRVGASANLSVGKAEARFEIKSLSKITQAQSVPMLYVSKLDKADSTLHVSVEIVGIGTRTMSVQTTLESLVKRLGSTRDNRVKDSLMGALKSFLAKEFEDEASFWGNPFDNNEGKLQIERVVRASKNLESGDLAQLRSMKNQIKEAYGKRPGFVTRKGDDWDSAMSLIDQI
jgi:hypothetical protein